MILLKFDVYAYLYDFLHFRDQIEFSSHGYLLYTDTYDC